MDMRKTLFFVMIALLVVSTLALVIITQQGRNPSLREWVTDCSLIILAVCAVGANVLAWNATPAEFWQERRCWIFSVLGFVCFALGDGYWAYSELVAKVPVPVGSFADLFWNLAYLFLGLGLFFLLRTMFFPSKKKVYLVLFVTFAIAFAYAYVHVGKVVMVQGSFGDVVNDLYVLYDIILLGMVALLLVPLLFYHNPLITPWLLFGFAILARIAFDFIFAGLVSAGAYQSGSYVDLLYALSYVLFTFTGDAKFNLLQRYAHRYER